MIKTFYILTLLLYAALSSAQQHTVLLIKDAVSGEAIPGASIVDKTANHGYSTDSLGRATILVTNYSFNISIAGYQSKIIQLPSSLTVTDTLFIFLLQREERELEQVIVSSSRTDSRIEDLATKVEVLGAGEVDEEGGLKPNNIASLLGDIAGIQTQQTSATSGGTELRVQGLPGRYTQILRDGMPLFGGYAGSFGILQIPPLDLKQIEIIKGASSTLYGGGAIAGMINLISKRPRRNVFEKTVLLNVTSLKEINVNAYLAKRNEKIGYTFFTGMNRQKQVDVDKDGFSDIPDLQAFFIHPVLFIYPDEKNLVYVGYNGAFEKREGGDMQVLKGNKDAVHQYFVNNHSSRNSIETNWEDRISTSRKLNVRGTASWLKRDITTNVFGMKANQLSYFTEISYFKKTKKHELVAGLNLRGENFKKIQPDSSLLKDENNFTSGVFFQDDWHVTPKFTIQTGIRQDHHNKYGSRWLPRISLMYKWSPHVTTRLGGGLGYKIPTAFSDEIDERDLKRLEPLTFASLRPEQSSGLNFDFNYLEELNDWEITYNQSVFLTQINDPLELHEDITSRLYYINRPRALITYGTESYIQIQKDKLELYLGYVYTVAKDQNNTVHPYISLSARNKFATVLAYEFTETIHAGIEAAFTGKQYLDNGRQSPAFPFFAAMARWDTGRFAFVVNCENLFDYRQSKKEAIVLPPYPNPIFAQLWAPIDGRAVNFSIRIKL